VNSTGLFERAAANVPRFAFNPATLAAEGLMIETQRQNALSNTKTMMDGNWVRVGASLTAPNDYPLYGAGGNVHYLKGDRRAMELASCLPNVQQQNELNPDYIRLPQATHGSMGSDRDINCVQDFCKFQHVKRDSWHSRWMCIIFNQLPGSQLLVPPLFDFL
jgi:hypothetical protein